MKFSELELKQPLLDVLKQLNIENCTDIQSSAIPLILEGKDISGLSKTGSGKTFAFLIPLIERILCTKKKDTQEATEAESKRSFESWHSGHFILVLAPTRELADQIHKNVTQLIAHTGLKSVLVYGGVEYEQQTKLLQDGVDIVVGTPGRLIDLYKAHHIHFRQVRAVVFDEADRMFDMGFKDDMVFILQRVPKERQILLFSATLNFDVLNTIYRFGANPVEINVSKDQVKAEEVQDEIFHIGSHEKPQFLLSVINRQKPKQTIIFSNFKNNVDRITQFLNLNQIPTVGISSLLTQNQRERVLEQFKNENERNTLVATDVAARGLDIKGVDLVINYDLPDDAENYVHRIGRTGRAGQKGTAFSLVSDRDVAALSRIEHYLKSKIPIGWIDDADLIKQFKPMPHDYERGESHVRKTGLAAVKASGNADNRNTSRHPRRDSRGEHPTSRYSQNSRNNYNGSQQPVHRDRKSGRHGQNASAQTAKPQNDFKANKSHKFKKNKDLNKKPYQQKSFKAQKKTENKISQKIKSFFKNLIGK